MVDGNKEQQSGNNIRLSGQQWGYFSPARLKYPRLYKDCIETEWREKQA